MMRWLRTRHGLLLGLGAFCFLAGVAAATSGTSAVAGFAAIALLAAGAITTTWGFLLTLRARARDKAATDHEREERRP